MQYLSRMYFGRGRESVILNARNNRHDESFRLVFDTIVGFSCDYVHVVIRFRQMHTNVGLLFLSCPWYNYFFVEYLGLSIWSNDGGEG